MSDLIGQDKQEFPVGSNKVMTNYNVYVGDSLLEVQDDFIVEDDETTEQQLAQKALEQVQQRIQQLMIQRENSAKHILKRYEEFEAYQRERLQAVEQMYRKARETQHAHKKRKEQEKRAREKEELQLCERINHEITDKVELK